MKLALVDSPLQALNTIEYLNSSSEEHGKCIFIIFSNSAVSSVNLKQIEFVLDFFCYYDRLILNVNGGFKGLIKSRVEVKALSKKLLTNHVEKCVLGEYRSLSVMALVNKINPKQVVVVDDGNATLRINRFSASGLQSKIKGLLANVLGLNISPPKVVTFFSVYEIKKNILATDTLLCNEYLFLKNKMLEYPNSKKEFIIGSPLQAAGVVEEDLKLTLMLIGCILKDKGVSRSQLLYISHRRESKAKLKSIFESGVEVVSLGYPFELYCLINKVNAVKIHGFYSSLFSNLLNLQNGILITSYEIPLNSINLSFKSFVKSVYNNYRNMADSRLKIISLNNNE